MPKAPSISSLATLTLALLLIHTAPVPARAAPPASPGTATFHDVTAQHPALAGYARVPSATISVAEALRAQSPVTMADFIGNHPIKPHGAPGAALADFDGDGDLDLYVTNGPGAANSLFLNLLADSGSLGFVDGAAGAGVEATDQDSWGVCAGDIDNDGDQDLYVLGRGEPNRLYENLGGGVFVDVTAASGTGGGAFDSTTCSMADFDGDGLLDIVVANTFDMASNLAIFVVPFALNQPNQLFVNQGGNVFSDESSSSGVGAALDITWAVAAVDLDQDGDADIVTANDNGAIPFASFGGVDRGFLRYLENDGTGLFTDRTAAVGLDAPGDWMGLAFADFDSSGTLDLFGSNSGDWFEDFVGIPSPLGAHASRWFLQRADGTFADPGVGPLVATPFGWGAAALDYDGDGDSDVVFYGGLDAGPIVESSNPGTLLANDGAAGFTYDRAALAPTGAAHALRDEHGLAVGDVDGDGFTDLVSVSAIDLPLPSGGAPVGPLPFPQQFGSPFDGLPLFFPSWLPGPNPGELVWSGVDFPPGTVALELSSGNGNGTITVRTRGSVGEVTGAGVNRDGIGAVLRVTPHRGATAIRPVLGGSSYASRNALATVFGLGDAPKATVEVLWPGGVRNRLDGVRPGERLLFPEIPCSFDDPSFTPQGYAACVRGALDELIAAGTLAPGDRGRFLGSALRAFAGASS